MPKLGILLMFIGFIALFIQVIYAASLQNSTIPMYELFALLLMAIGAIIHTVQNSKETK